MKDNEKVNVSSNKRKDLKLRKFMKTKNADFGCDKEWFMNQVDAVPQRQRTFECLREIIHLNEDGLETEEVEARMTKLNTAKAKFDIHVKKVVKMDYSNTKKLLKSIRTGPTLKNLVGRR